MRKTQREEEAEDDVLQMINKDISKKLNQQFSKKTNLNFEKFDLNEILDFSEGEKLRDEDEDLETIEITERDIETLLKAMNPDNMPKVTRKSLRQFLNGFPNVYQMQDIKFLLNNKSELDSKELYDLLKNNKLQDFDPLKETYNILDPENKGFINEKDFQSIMEAMGFTDITEYDLPVLLEVADKDGDGKITFEDFVSLVQEIDLGKFLLLKHQKVQNKYQQMQDQQQLQQEMEGDQEQEEQEEQEEEQEEEEQAQIPI
jgi:hypothetical protein